MNQFGRRNLPAYERARLALRMKPILAERAKERQGTRSDLTDIPQISAGSETRDDLAHAAGVSHDTIHKVEAIEARASEDTKQQLRSGEMSINQAYKANTGRRIHQMEVCTMVKGVRGFRTPGRIR